MSYREKIRKQTCSGQLSNNYKRPVRRFVSHSLKYDIGGYHLSHQFNSLELEILGNAS